MAPIKKNKNISLFSGGVLATTAASPTPETTLQPEQSQKMFNRSSGVTPRQPDVEDDDPFFGNVKRVQEMVHQAETLSQVPKVSIDLLDDNPYQPRRRMHEKKLQLLAQEIKEYGFKGAVYARQHPQDPHRYQLVFGHRRREAARLAGLTEIPTIIDDTISDKEMRASAVTENIMREDLTPIDEAYAYAAWQEEFSQDAIAARLGVSRGYIRNRLDILKAPQDVQDMVEEKSSTMSAVVYLKDIPETTIRQEAIQALLEEQITIHQIKAFVENIRKVQETPVPPPIQEKVSYPQSEAVSTRQPQQVAKRKEPSQSVQQAAIIERSREQTEAITDKAKLETFIKYLRQYEMRLQKRDCTSDEKASLDELILTAQRILQER